MRDWRKYLTVLGAALLLMLSACAEPAADDFAVARLLEESVRGTGVDFDPLVSPEDARRRSDLIVTGTLIDVVEGVQLAEPGSDVTGTPEARAADELDGETELVPLESAGSQYVSYVIAVDRVLWPREASVPATLEVQVLMNTSTTAAELAELNVRPGVLVALDAVETAEYEGQGLVVARTNGEAAGSRLYFPFTDMFWFETRSGLMSHYVDVDALSGAWGRPPTSIDDLAERIEP